MTARLASRALAALGAGLMLSACAALPVAPSALPATWIPSFSPSPISSEEVDSPLGFSLKERAAVRIRNVRCDGLATGSGFILDEHTIVTNHHVVEDPGLLEVTLSDGTAATVTDSAYATNADLAIITTAESLAPAVTLSTTSAVRFDVITVVGYPEGDALAVTLGMIQSLESDTLDNASFVYSTNAEAAPGSSGSAVYNEDGEVIGVLYAGSEDDSVAFIIPVVLLTAFLDNAGLRAENPAGCTPDWL